MNTIKQYWIPITIVLVIILFDCLIGLIFSCGGIFYLFNETQKKIANSTVNAITPTQLPVILTSFPEITITLIQTETQGLDMSPNLIEANITLKTLEDSVVPENNLRELAFRLEGKENIPEVGISPPQVFNIGDSQSFWITNTDTNISTQISMVLKYFTPHSYFWIEEGIQYNEKDLENLAETFESSIYPTNQQFFGNEWTPGIDNDLHLYIIYARGLGNQVAGYFATRDEESPLIHEYSNMHETIMINADTTALNDEYIYGVLAHELQHMIHWYGDRNETTWLNEGFAELAKLLNGYDIGGFDILFLSNPDHQLNDWPNDPNATSLNYGSAFLFVTYFLERVGSDTTQALIMDQNNGLDSIDKVLASLNKTDPVTGKSIDADNIFADWVVANYLNDDSVYDGRYVYTRDPLFFSVRDTDFIEECPKDWQSRQVSQYGADYIKIVCDGAFTLNFEGVSEVGVISENAHSGNYAFWSNKGDESNMTLTHEFDITQATGEIYLNYWLWYDLEDNYDYLYLEASEDGKHWQILKTASGTDKDTSGNSYGWGYNGKSSGWIKENVNISSYAGKKIYLRFEYVTDAAVNGEGMLIDDIEIPKIGYFSDFEDANGGWESAGFVRIQNRLPQTYIMSLIKKGTEIIVEQQILDSDQHLSIPVDFNADVNEIILTISGSTRFTRQPAIYRFNIE